MATFGDQVAGIVLELVKKMAADLDDNVDTKASRQIRCRTYLLTERIIAKLSQKTKLKLQLLAEMVIIS